jgi:hypothetical protein
MAAEVRRFALVLLHAVAERAATRFPLADDPAVLIKDVGTSHAADATMALLPRSRFLLLVRDGRDVFIFWSTRRCPAPSRAWRSR